MHGDGVTSSCTCCVCWSHFTVPSTNCTLFQAADPKLRTCTCFVRGWSAGRVAKFWEALCCVLHVDASIECLG
jgi:hypothetical protein